MLLNCLSVCVCVFVFVYFEFILCVTAISLVPRHLSFFNQERAGLGTRLTVSEYL